MEITESLGIFKALADSSRLVVFHSLLVKPQYVEEIATRVKLSPSTVSFHLKKLEQAGLVEKRKDQYYAVYSANADITGKTLGELVTFKNPEDYLQDERIRKYEEKVIKTFFKDGRLTHLPKQLKKKMIILEKFKKQFQPNKQYPEREVNAVIGEYYDDYCTIRRLFIEHGIMTRFDGIYWLTDKD